MQYSTPKKLRDTMGEALAYLDKISSDASIDPDFPKLHRYLTELAPHLRDSVVSTDLLRTVARLYFESMRYAESAEVLEQLDDFYFNEMRVNNDFYNGYYTTFHDWESRQKDIWKAFREAERTFKEGNENLARDINAFRRSVDPYFPTAYLLVRPPKDGEKGSLVLGTPGGIFSLVPLLYLIQNAPTAIAKRWSLLLEEPAAGSKVFLVSGEKLRVRDTRVQVSPGALYSGVSMVRLTLWHPVLAELSRKGQDAYATELAAQMVKAVLPLSAVARYVEQISISEVDLPETDSMPLPDLKDWFQERNLMLDVPAKEILDHRRLSFTRTPNKAPHPRADITRGETCLPELEEITFLRDRKAMAAIQRYGMGYWYLTIPRKVCGEDFAAFRKKLQAQVRKEQGDKVFFTGWAEGTRNCYIDFLSMNGKSTLNSLNQYLKTLPRGKDIRICSFYWNAELRTADLFQEMSAFQLIEMRLAMNPAAAQPPLDHISAADCARMEKAFRETQWSAMGAPSEAEQAAEAFSKAYEENLRLLKETVQHINEHRGKDLDHAQVHRCLQLALPGDPAADIGEDYRDKLTLVLAGAGRYRESVRWASPLSETQRQVCDLGSSYPSSSYQWEVRRQELWVHFAAVESDLAKQLAGGGTSTVETDFRLWADSVFPGQELALLPGQKGKNAFLTGLPDGILTLPAMLYLTSHYPSTVGTRWKIGISGDSLPAFVPVGRRSIPAREVRVSLTQKDGKLSLAVWHPKLAQLAEADAQEAQRQAVRLVNCALPMGARLLHAPDITAALETPEDAFALSELQQQMQAMGFQTEIPLDTLLSRRRYTIAREPKDTGRPRDDIFRGETCMPELERIYRRLYEEGQIVLERYGLYAVFLMIPKAVCEEDPLSYSQQVQRTISLAEGDKVFFTGWAEGTRYMYLDLISMHGDSLLSALDTYARSSPAGGQFQFSTFYWGSRPYAWLIDAAYEQIVPEDLDNPDIPAFLQNHLFPDIPVPDGDTAAAFEASFRPLFTLADFCASKAPEAPAAVPQKSTVGKKKLSKAQRKGQNSGKNGKKKR